MNKAKNEAKGWAERTVITGLEVPHAGQTAWRLVWARANRKSVVVLGVEPKRPQ